MADDTPLAPPGRRSWPTAVLVLALVALVALSAWAHWGRDRGADDAGARVAAERAAVAFFGLDHRTIEDDVADMTGRSTGSFREVYEERSEELAARVTSQSLVVQATVPDSGIAVEFLDADDARVLVAVDTSTTAAGIEEPEEQRYRARVVLRLVEDEWLVSGLEEVG